MVKVVRTRPCRREPAPGDSISIYFTACSVFDGGLAVWAQMIELDDPFNEYQQKIDDEAQNIPTTTPRDYIDGEVVLVKYNCDQRWYRGKVMNKIIQRKNSYRVRLLDYGNVEIVDEVDIKSLPEELSEESFPAHACKFFLSGIHPTQNVWSTDAMHAVEKFSVYREFTVDIVAVHEDRVYEIHSAEINSYLQSLDICRQVCQQELRGFISHLLFDDPLSFYLQPNQHPSGESLQSLSAAINNVYSNQTAPKKLAREFTVPNSYCIALYVKSQFARARIISVDQTTDSVRILFIDYGYTTTVLRNSLCAIQSQFVDLAPFAVKCRVFNCQLTSSRSSSELFQHVKEMIGYESQHPKEVHCTVVGPSMVQEELLVRCNVLQNSLELSSGIRIERRPLSKAWVTAAAPDATTRPRAKSPSSKRSKHLATSTERDVESPQYLKSETIPCIISALEDNYVWVVPADMADARDKFVEELDQFIFSDNKVALPTNPGLSVGRVCVARWSVDGKYYRVRLEENDKLRFLDYGNNVPLHEIDTYQGYVDELSRIPEDFRAAPFALCTLPCGNPSREFLVEKMEENVSLDTTFRRLKPLGQSQMAWLVDFPKWNELQKLKIAENRAATETRFNKGVSEKAIISHIDTVRCTVSLSFEADQPKREVVQETILMISDEGQLSPLEDGPINTGQLVLAIYPSDLELYRGKVLSYDEYLGQVEVEFIDFGDSCFVNLMDLYFYDEVAFKSAKPLAYLAHINGLESTTLRSSAGALFEFFAANYTGANLSATITDVKDGEIWVDLAYTDSSNDFLFELYNGYKAAQMFKPTITYFDDTLPFEETNIFNNNNELSPTGVYLTQAEDGCFYPVLCESEEQTLTSPSLPESC